MRAGSPHLTEAQARLPVRALELITVGDHRLKRRLNLGLTRKAAAAEIRVDDTLENWEKGRTKVEVRYNPIPEPKTRGQAVAKAGMSRGLSRRTGVVPCLRSRRSTTSLRSPGA